MGSPQEVVTTWFDRWKFWPNFVIILQKQPAARMNEMPCCPRCGSEKVIKNGSIHNGRPKFSCKECRRQFVENPSNKIIPKETWDIVDKLLLEKISAAGISMVTGISEIWIQKHMNKNMKISQRQVELFLKKPSDSGVR